MNKVSKFLTLLTMTLVLVGIVPFVAMANDLEPTSLSPVDSESPTETFSATVAPTTKPTTKPSAASKPSATPKENEDFGSAAAGPADPSKYKTMKAKVPLKSVRLKKKGNKYYIKFKKLKKAKKYYIAVSHSQYFIGSKSYDGKYKKTFTFEFKAKKMKKKKYLYVLISPYKKSKGVHYQGQETRVKFKL